MKKLFLSVAVAFGVLTLASSCLNSGDTTNPTQGALLVGAYSPDASGLNMSLNSKPYITNITYTGYTQYYLQTAGSYTIGVTDASNANVLSSTVTIDPNKYYSYFVIDSVSHLKYAFMEDKLTQPGTDSVYIRFLNFSPDAGPIGLRDSATHNYFYQSRNFNDQGSDPSKTGFKEIKQGAFTLQLIRADSSVAASRKDTLAAGHSYTIIASGFSGSTDNKKISIQKIIFPQ